MLTSVAAVTDELFLLFSYLHIFISSSGFVAEQKASRQGMHACTGGPASFRRWYVGGLGVVDCSIRVHSNV